MKYFQAPISNILYKYFHSSPHPGKLRLFRYVLKILGSPYLEVPYQTNGRILVNPLYHPDNVIFENGIYEQEVAECLLENLRDEDVFWDIGAHIGSYALLALLEKRDASVTLIAFEPNPAIRRVLEINLEINEFAKKSTVCPMALSDKELTARLVIPCKDNPGSAQLTDESQGIEVQTTTVDALLKQGYPAPDIIKMDVEGNEFATLRGARNLLSSHPPHTILFEADAKEGNLPTELDLVHLLRDSGYTIHHIPRPSGWRSSKENFVASRLENSR
jgi:FkbM family methyltransferase